MDSSNGADGEQPTYNTGPPSAVPETATEEKRNSCETEPCEAPPIDEEVKRMYC